jgi:hypothetical protein
MDFDLLNLHYSEDQPLKEKQRKILNFEDETKSLPCKSLCVSGCSINSRKSSISVGPPKHTSNMIIDQIIVKLTKW